MINTIKSIEHPEYCQVTDGKILIGGQEFHFEVEAPRGLAEGQWNIADLMRAIKNPATYPLAVPPKKKRHAPYWSFEHFTPVGGIQVDPAQFAQAVDKTFYAIGENQMWKNLMGLHLSDGYAEGADAFRIAEFKLFLEYSGAAAPGLIIHKAGLKALAAAQDTGYHTTSGKLTLYKRGGHDWIGSNGFVVRCIDATYPELSSVKALPDETVRLNRAALVDALDGIFTWTGEDHNAICKIDLVAGCIFSQSLEQGQYPPRRISAEGAGTLQTGLNIKFALDALKNLDAKEFSFSYSGPVSPVQFNGDDDLKQILMPFKINW